MISIGKSIHTFEEHKEDIRPEITEKKHSKPERFRVCGVRPPPNNKVTVENFRDKFTSLSIYYISISLYCCCSRFPFGQVFPHYLYSCSFPSTPGIAGADPVNRNGAAYTPTDITETGGTNCFFFGTNSGRFSIFGFTLCHLFALLD